MHCFGPASGQRANQPAPVQQVIDDALDDVSLAALDAQRIGSELAGFGIGVQGDLLTALVVDPQQAQFLSHTNLVPDVLAIAMDAPPGLLKDREQTG